MTSDKQRLLSDLRTLCAPFGFMPSIAPILAACDADSIRAASVTVNAALRDKRLRGTALARALWDWGQECNRLRELVIAERETAA